jgi:hypothetical protein
MRQEQNHRRYSPLFFASEGINQSWKMQRNLKLPAHTTRWQDLPRVQLG